MSKSPRKASCLSAGDVSENTVLGQLDSGSQASSPLQLKSLDSIQKQKSYFSFAEASQRDGIRKKYKFSHDIQFRKFSEL